MSEEQKVTKEEFVQAVRDVVSFPEEFRRMCEQGQTIAKGFEMFDPEMSRRVLAVVDAMKAVRELAVERLRDMGEPR